MDDMKRGDDAADHALRHKPDSAKDGKDGKDGKDARQEAPNYRETTGSGQAIEPEDVSSANDE